MQAIISRLNSKILRELNLRSNMVNSGKFFSYILDRTWEAL